MIDRKWMEMYDQWYCTAITQMMGEFRWAGEGQVFEVMDEPEYWVIAERTTWRVNRRAISEEVALMVQTRAWPQQ